MQRGHSVNGLQEPKILLDTGCFDFGGTAGSFFPSAPRHDRQRRWGEHVAIITAHGEQVGGRVKDVIVAVQPQRVASDGPGPARRETAVPR